MTHTLTHIFIIYYIIISKFRSHMMKSAVIATTFAIAVSAGSLKTKPGGEVWDEETCVSRLWL